jgi:hypothetical protein
MANKVSYLDNLQKELGQWRSAARGGTNRSGKPTGVKSDEDAYKSALGQLSGAILQGRRYSDKTGKQIKAKKK